MWEQPLGLPCPIQEGLAHGLQLSDGLLSGRDVRCRPFGFPLPVELLPGLAEFRLCRDNSSLASFPCWILAVPFQRRGERIVITVLLRLFLLFELRLSPDLGPHGAFRFRVLVALGRLALNRRLALAWHSAELQGRSRVWNGIAYIKAAGLTAGL